MTEEQKSWYEYALAKDAWERIKRIWWIPGESKVEQKCRITYAIENNTYSKTAICWRNYIAAHKKAMAWIPTHRRTCENCGCLCRDEDNPSQWYCVRYNIDEDGLNPDEASCAEWEPMEGGQP